MRPATGDCASFSAVEAKKLLAPNGQDSRECRLAEALIRPVLPLPKSLQTFEDNTVIGILLFEQKLHSRIPGLKALKIRSLRVNLGSYAIETGFHLLR